MYCGIFRSQVRLKCWDDLRSRSTAFVTTAKAMAMLLEDAVGGPFDPADQDWADLAELAGYKQEVWERLLAERDGSEKC